MLDRAKIGRPDKILILGASTIGLIATVVASKLGIPEIAVAGANLDVPVRMPLSKELGASRTINAQEQDLKSAMDKFAGPDGIEIIMECSGSPAAISSAIRLLRRRGKLLLLGLVSSPEISVPWNDILYKEIDIVSSFSSTASDWERVINMLPDIKSGLNKIITHTIPLEDWQKGFELMKTGKAVKVMVEINRQAG
jgi:L-iditol 2-dehydrogenase